MSPRTFCAPSLLQWSVPVVGLVNSLDFRSEIVSLFRIKLPSYRMAITNKLLDYVLCLDLSIECKMKGSKTIWRDIWRFLE